MRLLVTCHAAAYPIHYLQQQPQHYLLYFQSVAQHYHHSPPQVIQLSPVPLVVHHSIPETDEKIVEDINHIVKYYYIVMNKDKYSIRSVENTIHRQLT